MCATVVTDQGNSIAEDKLVRLQSRFVRAAKTHNVALEALDAERAEACAHQLGALHEALLVAGEQGKEKLLALLDNGDPAVAGMAAVFALRINPERCLGTLRRVATEPGLLGFRASAAIERWETGERE